MTASSCRSWFLLHRGLSLYFRLLSLHDAQLSSPFLALLYSACAIASCFVLGASAVTCLESAALLPASKLVAASRICAACDGSCMHLFCHTTLIRGQRFPSERLMLCKMYCQSLISLSVCLFKMYRLNCFRDL